MSIFRSQKMVLVEVAYGQDLPVSLQGILSAMHDVAVRAARLEGFKKIEAEIIIVNDQYIKELNTQYRGIAASTDVLSFPSNDLSEPLNKATEAGFVPEYGLRNHIALGEVYISLDTAIHQAEEYGNTLKEELRFLTAHGMLHLLGYDHMEAKEERIMREKQRVILGRATKDEEVRSS